MKTHIIAPQNVYLYETKNHVLVLSSNILRGGRGNKLGCSGEWARALHTWQVWPLLTSSALSPLMYHVPDTRYLQPLNHVPSPLTCHQFNTTFQQDQQVTLLNRIGTFNIRISSIWEQIIHGNIYWKEYLLDVWVSISQFSNSKYTSIFFHFTFSLCIRCAQSQCYDDNTSLLGLKIKILNKYK